VDAAVGFVKLFPNLEAALKGVFNRVVTKLNLFYNNLGDTGEKAVRDAVKEKDRIGFELMLQKPLFMQL
jgi:hypothetical protein